MFNKHTPVYFLGIFLLAIAFIVVGLLIFKYFESTICLKHFLYVLCFFFLTNTVFHFFLIFLFEKKPNKFFQIFLLLTVAKILVYMTFLIVYILSIDNGIKCYLISFFIIYLGFTIYEVIMLREFLKNKKRNN